MLLPVDQRDHFSQKKIANKQVTIELEEIISKVISKMSLNEVKKDNQEKFYEKTLPKVCRINMPEYGFSLTYIFQYKNRTFHFVLIRENMGQRKPIFWHI